MLIIPCNKKVDWKNPPLITLALVLINCAIFFSYQLSDNQHAMDAVVYYQDSDLPDYELPAYVAYLRDQGGDSHADELAVALADGSGDEVAVLFEMQGDGAFMQRLRSGEVVVAEDEGFSEWRTQRTEFDEQLNLAVYQSHGLKPAEPTLLTMFSHMFLHGGLGHLFGNMVFLFLIGFVVETIMGRSLYLAAYILAGLLSGGLDVVINSNSMTPSVGASGAISGLMGMYVVLFGLRKIQFFYSVVVYFGYVTLPALIVLPLWLGKELFQMLFSDVQSINYLAHIGGLMGGALIAWLVRQRGGGLGQEYMDAEAKQGDYTARYQQAMDQLAALNYDQAKSLMWQLITERKDDLALQRQLYKIEKIKPDSASYHRLVHLMLETPLDDSESELWVKGLFNEYLQQAKPGIRLSTEQCNRLARRFIRKGVLQEADLLVRNLLKEASMRELMPELLYLLAVAYLRSQQRELAERYLNFTIKHFPMSSEAGLAKQLLAQP